MRVVIILILLALGVTAARSFSVGGEGSDVGAVGVEVPGVPSGGGAHSTCGTGVIDASAGCPIPMLGM